VIILGVHVVVTCLTVGGSGWTGTAGVGGDQVVVKYLGLDPVMTLLFAPSTFGVRWK